MKSSLKTVLTLMCFILFSLNLMNCSSSSSKSKDDNPFLDDAMFDNLDFSKIKLSHFLPALDKGIEQANTVINQVINNEEEPSFENVILPLEYDFKILNRVNSVFFNLTDTISNAEMSNIEKTFSSKITKFENEMNFNKNLFKKIKQLDDKKDSLSLSPESLRLLKLYLKRHINSGINLSDDKQNTLKKINETLTQLTTDFKNNLALDSESLNILEPSNTSNLEGISQSAISAYKKAANDSDKEGFLIPINQTNVMEIILVEATNRDLRKKALELYHSKGKQNISVIKDIINLRIKKAQLMGHKNHASFVLQDTMAKDPNKILNLLDKLFKKAQNKANLEKNTLEKFAQETLKDPNFKLEKHDWLFWEEKFKSQKLALDQNEVKKFLELSSVRNGVFTVIGKLYDLEFIKIDKSVYHPDVEVFRVQNINTKEFIGELYLDYFAREGKTSGAWSSNFRSQSLDKTGNNNITPIVTCVFNFLKPADGGKVLLSPTDVTKLFHELGHATQALVANCRYPSLSENIARDFVELPSQILEKWAFDKEVLPLYAKDENGNTIPDSIITKLEQLSTFNTGFVKTEYLASAILDTEIHLLDKEDDNLDVTKLEDDILKKHALIPEIAPRYKLPYFQHSFLFGYDAQYYSYIWSDILVEDAFSIFKQKGIFNREVADSFKQHVLSPCASEDPDILYKRFSKKEQPSEDLLIKSLGFDIDENSK